MCVADAGGGGRIEFQRAPVRRDMDFSCREWARRRVIKAPNRRCCLAVDVDGQFEQKYLRWAGGVYSGSSTIESGGNMLAFLWRFFL